MIDNTLMRLVPTIEVSLEDQSQDTIMEAVTLNTWLVLVAMVWEGMEVIML